MYICMQCVYMYISMFSSHLLVQNSVNVEVSLFGLLCIFLKMFVCEHIESVPCMQEHLWPVKLILM